MSLDAYTLLGVVVLTIAICPLFLRSPATAFLSLIPLSLAISGFARMLGGAWLGAWLFAALGLVSLTTAAFLSILAPPTHPRLWPSTLWALFCGSLAFGASSQLLAFFKQTASRQAGALVSLEEAALGLYDDRLTIAVLIGLALICTMITTSYLYNEYWEGTE